MISTVQGWERCGGEFRVCFVLSHVFFSSHVAPVAPHSQHQQVPPPQELHLSRSAEQQRPRDAGRTAVARPVRGEVHSGGAVGSRLAHGCTAVGFHGWANLVLRLDGSGLAVGRSGLGGWAVGFYFRLRLYSLQLPEQLRPMYHPRELLTRFSGAGPSMPTFSTHTFTLPPELAVPTPLSALVTKHVVLSHVVQQPASRSPSRSRSSRRSWSA